MNEEERKKLHKAHDLSTRHERIFFEIPDGEDEEPALITTLYQLRRWFRRRAWARRFVLIQLPLIIAAAGSIYGAGTLVYDFIIKTLQ